MFDIDCLNGHTVKQCIYSTNDNKIHYLIYCNTTIFVARESIVTFEVFKDGNIIFASTDLGKIKYYVNNL